MPTPNMKEISAKSVYIQPMGRKWRRVLWFDKKRGVFIIDMPKAFTTLFPDDKVEAKDVETIEAEFKKAVYKWETADIKWRKVIIYRFCIAMVDERGILRRDDFKASFDKFPDNSIGFEWEVCRERTAKGEVRYFKIWQNERGPEDWDNFPPSVQAPEKDAHRGKDSNSPTQVLDWTAEREAFFLSMGQSLRALVLRAQDFETKIKDPEVLDKLAASNTLLLAAPAKDKP